MWSLFLNRYTIGAALLVISHLYAYQRGYSAADKAAELAEVRAALQAAYGDLNAQRVAAEHMRRAAEENGEAARRNQELVDDYERELQTRGDADRCTLDSRDIERMRPHGNASPQKPAGR